MAQARLPALISLSLSEDQAAIVAELAGAFITSNSEYSEELTQEARKTAREQVTPVSKSFAQGEMIVSTGQVLDDARVEALQKLGLVQPEGKWQDLVSAATLAVLTVTFVALYLRRKRRLTGNLLSLTLIMAMMLLFLVAARLMIPTHVLIPYAFPVAAYALTVAALFDTELALVSSLPLAILCAYGLPNALELTLYYSITSLFGVLALGRARRLIAFLWAGAAVAVSGSAIILIYRLPLPSTDMVGISTLTAAAIFNGFACASVSLVLQTMMAQLLGTTTPIQLMDLTRPDQPLLKILLRDAPGTYQHSLQVSNLAEQAGERIGADSLLIRVGALYHDVGKTCNPFYFIENQPPGYQNPHDDLPPIESAHIIIRHVTDGIELGRKHRLPRRILDFMTEHHGTGLARYQYVKAVKQVGGDQNQVDLALFRYPGPRPQSRETAILMLADGCEARVRAERPTQVDELHRIVKEVVNNRIDSGQLDDTRLTLTDLNQIVESFASTLRGVYHPRVIYPRLEQGAEGAASARPDPADTPAKP
jgi:putative nucleotidyltransferase with HDIG domain